MINNLLNSHIQQNIHPLLSINILLAERQGDTVKNSLHEPLKFLHIENSYECSSDMYDNKEFDTALYHKSISRTFEVISEKQKLHE